MKNKKMIKTLYIIYLIVLFLFAMKIIGSSNILFSMRESIKANRLVGIYNINLIPFKTIMPFIKNLPSIVSIKNIFGNIILFLPLGTFPSLLKYKHSKMIITSTLFVLIIELTQLIFYFGYFDIDDFILNIIGAICGYYIGELYKKIRE